MIKKKIKMDLSINNTPQVVYAVQGDTNTRNVVIDLYNAGAAWTVPDGASGVVKFQKADGKGGIYDKLPNGFPAVVYEENSNQIEVSLAPQVLTFPGEVKSQVSLIYDNNIISTFSFVVLVQADPSANAEKSTDYVNWDRYFIPQTSGASVGQYLKITKVDDLGRVVEVSPVDAPSGSGTIDGDLDMESKSILNLRSLEFWNEDELATVVMQAGFPDGDNESEDFNGVIEFRTSRGDEPVTLRNIAPAKNPDEAVSKKQLEYYIAVHGGLTAEQISALDGMFKICAYTADATDAYKAFKTAFGIGGEVEPEEPDVPKKTLTSISAVYSGGSVTAGTAVNDLTDIVVTAHYSDGTSKIVTDYTLSGEIAEGSNAITVSYGGKTTTFNVIGVAAEATSLRGLQLPVVPSNFTTNENWQYAGNAGNLNSVISTNYMYLKREFTGTVWIRSMTGVPFSTISMGMALVAEDYIINQTADGERMTATQTWNQFDGQYLRVSEDGSEYKFSSDYPSDGLRYVRLSRFDIPEGQHAILYAANAGTGNGHTINVDGGWMTVFFEDPTEHITVTEVVE